MMRMKKLLLALGSIFFLVVCERDALAAMIEQAFVPEPPTRQDDPLWKEALSFWAKREKSKNIDQALELFKKLAANHPDQIEPELWLARVYFIQGVKDNQGKKGIATMKESALHSQKVLKADPENIYALYWLSSAIGFADQANLADSTIKKLAEKIPAGRELPVPEGVPAYQEALSHWDKRGNLDETRRAMEIWERITQDDPRAFAAYAWLARAHYWLGENEETKEEREKLHHRGYEFGKKAVALRPRHSGANFWTGANLARYAKDGSFLRQARLAPAIFHYVKISIQEEPIYFYLGSSRYIGYCMAYAGSLTRKFLPILGFDPERVVPLLKLAAVFVPSYLETNQALAECTISLGDPVQARQSLEFVLGQDPKALPEREAENVLYQNKARKLIQTMKLE